MYLDDAYIVLNWGHCAYCNQMGKVGLIVDPYVAELYNREEWDWFHEACAYEAWLDT
jgi:hypothetical protein